MLKKRIGNDISFTWRIYRKESDDVVPETFEGKDVIVELISPRQRPAEIENISISAGVVGFVFKGKKQRVPGSYTAVLLENKGEDGMVTLDVVDAVTLVPHSYMEEDGDEGDVIEATSVELASTISAGGGIEQQQADWAQTDDTAVDFIKNKPNVVSVGEDGVTIDKQFLCLLREAEGKIQRVVLNTPEQGNAYVAVIDNLHSLGVQIYPWCIQFHDGDNYALVGTLKPHEASYRGRLEYNSQELAFMSDLDGKQDTISDLETIRSGAAAGATAVQPADLTPTDDRLDDVEYCLGDYIKGTYVFNANNKPEVSTEPVYTDKTLYTAVNKGGSVMSLNCKLSSSSQEIPAVWIGRLYNNGKILFTKSGTATLYLVLYAGISLYYPNNILLSICDSNDNVVRNIRTTELTYNSSKICTAFSCEVADGYYIKMVYNDPNSYVWLGQIDFEITEVKQISTDVHANSNAIAAIEQKIPAQASPSNKLVDEDSMNSSIATATATFRGAFNLVTDLHLSVSATHAEIATALATAIQTADNNDYCYVQIPVADDTPTEFASVERYKYNGTAWEYEYTLNNSGFTAAQWTALNSGITSGLVAKLSALPTNSELTTLLGGKANTADLAPVATSGSYNDLSGKPTVDDTPTSDSNNLVKSGGVANSLISLANNLLEISDNDRGVQEITSGGTFKGYLKSNGTWGNITETSSFDTNYYQVKKGEILKIYHIGGTNVAKYGFFLNVPSSTVYPDIYKPNTDDTTKDIIIAPDDGYITLSNSTDNNRKCYRISSVQSLIDAAQIVPSDIIPIVSSGYIKGNGTISNYGSTSVALSCRCWQLEAGKIYKLYCSDLEGAYANSDNGKYLIGYGLNSIIPESNGAIDYFYDMYLGGKNIMEITPQSNTYLLVNLGNNSNIIKYFSLYEKKGNAWIEVWQKFDEIDAKTAATNEELARITSPYDEKKCLYIGDSISTKNNYQWKGFLESAYNLKYVRDISGQLAPASGGITVKPRVEDESETPISQKSIWYRCAENRMSIYDFDIISLFGGTNDMVDESLTIGTENDVPYVDDTSSFTEGTVTDIWSENLTFAQCLMGCIEMLKRDFPTKEIVICTVMPCGASYGNWTDPVTGLIASEAIANLQVRIADKYELKVIPFYWNVRTVENTHNYTFSKDRVHPNLPCALRMRASFAEILCL